MKSRTWQTSAVAFLAVTGTASAATLPGGLSNFDIDGTAVRADVSYYAQVTVLGAEISHGGKYDAPVTLALQFGEETREPFGDPALAVTANLNDGERGQAFQTEAKQLPSRALTITASSWLRHHPNEGDDNADYYEYLSVSSDSNAGNVRVLRNGDAVPEVLGVHGQQSVGDLVVDFIDPRTGRMNLWDDEVIFLFELGTTNMNSNAADFQDLVVLVTLAENSSRFDRPRVAAKSFGD